MTSIPPIQTLEYKLCIPSLKSQSEMENIEYKEDRNPSRLRQLLFAEEQEETDTDRQLHNQRYPKPGLFEPLTISAGEIRENASRSKPVGRCGSSQNSRDRSKNLSRDKGEGDVNPSKCLK